MGATDFGVKADATTVNELVREKVSSALRVRQLQHREEILMEELKTQRHNALVSIEQLEREATERKDLRSEIDALQSANDGLKGRLETAERDRREAESKLREAATAVFDYRKKTEELIAEKSDLAARLAQRWEVVAHQHNQASELRTIAEADRSKELAAERAKQAESQNRDLLRSCAALKGQVEVLKLEKRRNDDLQVETADLKQQLLEKAANFDGLNKKVSEMQDEVHEKDVQHLVHLSRLEMEVSNLRETGEEYMQKAHEAGVQFQEKLRDQEMEWNAVVSSLRSALLDATDKIGALSKGHDEHVKQLKNQIVRMEKRAVRDTESTVDGIVAWKMEALKKTREAVERAEDDARVEAKELQVKLASCCEARARTNSELADISHSLSYEKGKAKAMEHQVEELKKLLQAVQDELAEVNHLNSRFREDNSTLSQEAEDWKALHQSNIQQLETSKKSALALERQFLEVTEKLQIAVDGLSATNARLSAVDAERAVHQRCRKEAEDKGQMLEQLLDETKTHEAQKNLRCEQIEAELAKMTAEVAEQRKEAEAAKHSLISLESHFTVVQGENDELRKVLAAVEFELNACQNHVTELQKDVSSGNKQVTEAIEARIVLEEALGRVRADLEVKVADYEALEASHADLQKQMKQAGRDITLLLRSYMSSVRHWQTRVDDLLQKTLCGFGGFADQHLNGIVVQLKAAENVRPTPPSCALLQEVHGAWKKRKRVGQDGKSDRDTLPKESESTDVTVGSEQLQDLIAHLTTASEDVSQSLDSLQDEVHDLVDLSAKSTGIVLEAAVDAQKRAKETMKKCLLKASMHSATALKPEEALLLMDMDSRQDREVHAFLSDIATTVQDTMELLKDKHRSAEADLECAEGKIEALVNIRDQQELQIHDLNKALGSIRAQYHEAQESLIMMDVECQDAVKKMEEAAMKLRIESSDSDNVREDMKAGLKKVGELEAEVERLQRAEDMACQTTKKVMEMGAEKFCGHRQGWCQIHETVGRMQVSISRLKVETAEGLESLKEVCKNFFKCCEFKMTELARQKQSTDLALQQIASKRGQRPGDTSEKVGPQGCNVEKEAVGNNHANTENPAANDASLHASQGDASIEG